VRALRGERALHVRAVVGIAAVLLQLALPAVHSLEVCIASAESAVSSEPNGSRPEIVRLAETSDTPRVAGPSSSQHDALNCPICTALSHVHATTSDAARVPATIESGPPVIPTDGRTPPVSEVASTDARAPPSTSRIAIS